MVAVNRVIPRYNRTWIVVETITILKRLQPPRRMADVR